MTSVPNLILVGPTGAGKTELGGRVARRFGLRLVDLDACIEAEAGCRIGDLFAREGEAGFRARESAALARALDGHGVLLATGGGAVLDAGNRERMRRGGLVVHLHVALPEQLRRLASATDRPLLARPDREQVLAVMAQVREPLYAQVADLRLDTTGLEPEAATAALIALLDRHGFSPEL